MLEPPGNTDPAAWQRYFAMSANNAAWDLSTQPMDAARVAELLDAAHASAWHWKAVGTELNRIRAAMLLAQAHALAGHGATALAYAREVRNFLLARPDTPDWEIAMTHAVHAHAAHAAGKHDDHRASYALATSAVQAIAKPQDRAIVEQTFRLDPAP